MREKNNYTPDFGRSIELEIINNHLTMEFLEFDKTISRIWFQLSVLNSQTSFAVANFDEQFDISLQSNVGEDVHVWDLANLGNSLDIQSLVLGVVDARSRKPQELELQYKVISQDGLLSSGTMMVEYMPIPDDFELSDPYPNPFNPTATVRYALPVDGDMTLSVYDLQGRQVTVLASGFKTAGYYEAVWNGSNHSSGLYFIRMNVYGSGNTLQFNKFQKIMLVK